MQAFWGLGGIGGSWGPNGLGINVQELRKVS